MYKWTQKYIGIPFVSGGRDKTGCDCYGLVRLILGAEYGYNLPLLSGDYTNALCLKETKALFDSMVPLLCGRKLAAPEVAAVALIRNQGQLSHVALYAGDGFIIHTRYRANTVCERIANPRLTGSIEGWYRLDDSYRTV